MKYFSMVKNLDNGSSRRRRTGAAGLTLVALLDRLARSASLLALLGALGSLLGYRSIGRSVLLSAGRLAGRHALRLALRLLLLDGCATLGALGIASGLALGGGLLLLADIGTLLLALRHALRVLLAHGDGNLNSLVRLLFDKHLRRAE